MTDAAHYGQSHLPEANVRRTDELTWWQKFPWWAVLTAAIIAYMAIRVAVDADYRLAFSNIIPGIWITLAATVATFIISSIIGLGAGLGQLSENVVLRTISRTYVEVIRGIPMLPLIFTIALVIVPDVSSAMGFANRVPNFWRAVLALSLIYAAYMAEIFRGGIQSIPKGQFEAGRSLGLSRSDTMNSVIFPQAMRAIIPPIGNDFIAILKDTSLLSVLGILEMTRRARQFTASSFKFREGFFTLSFVYLVLVIALSLFVRWVEKVMTPDRQGER